MTSVVEIETVPTTAANFRRPRAARPGPSGGAVTASRPILLAAARRLLPRPALWVGPAVDGLELRLVQRQTLARFFPAGSPPRRSRTTGLDLLYGSVRNGRPDWRGLFLEIQQATTPEPAYGFFASPLSIEPPPSAGYLRLERRPLPSSPTGAIWLGQLRSRGLYLTFTGSSHAIVLRAARALTQIRA